MAPVLASIFFVIFVTLLADILIIAVLESTNDLDEILLNCGVIGVIAVGLVLLAPFAIELPVRFQGGFASTALFGPAGVFFVLKGTRTPRWLKWTFFGVVYTLVALWFGLLLPASAQS